jgi:hypothetical protein
LSSTVAISVHEFRPAASPGKCRREFADTDVSTHCSRHLSAFVGAAQPCLRMSRLRRVSRSLAPRSELPARRARSCTAAGEVDRTSPPAARLGGRRKARPPNSCRARTSGPGHFAQTDCRDTDAVSHAAQQQAARQLKPDQPNTAPNPHPLAPSRPEHTGQDSTPLHPAHRRSRWRRHRADQTVHGFAVYRVHQAHDNTEDHRTRVRVVDVSRPSTVDPGLITTRGTE